MNLEPLTNPAAARLALALLLFVPAAPPLSAAGQPLSIDPPGYGSSDVTTFTYDPERGNLIVISRTDPLLGTTTFEYDAFNRRTAVIAPNGVRTEITYDALDRILSVTQKGATPAEDLKIRHEYNAFGDLYHTILPRGNVLEYGYDQFGRLISIEKKPDATTPGERTLYTLDLLGNRIKEELQSWSGTVWTTESWTEFHYRNRCQIGKVVHADGNVTEYSYTCDGQIEKVWDANHPRATHPTPSQQYAYDELGRMISVTQSWTGSGGSTAVTSYSYDAQDHLTSLTDAEGNTTAYTYSDRDLLTEQTSPLSGTTTYAYNEHGEKVTEIDEKGTVLTRTVDAADRVTALTWPSPDLNATYEYDDPAVPFSKGRPTRIVRHGEAVEYRYDRFGRLLQDGALSYAYDANGNPVSLVYPGGVEAVTAYDFADRPSSLVVRRPGHPDQPLVTDASYLPSGPLAGLTLGNGLTETRTFTTRYFPSSLTVSGCLGWAYSTDAEGNVTAITDLLNGASPRSYAYQAPQYFLTQGDGPWGQRRWSYDRIGNRLREDRETGSETYHYFPNATGGNSPQIDRIVSSSGSTAFYRYDETGNVLENGRLPFSYGADRRLSQSGKPETATTYTYDGRGFLSRSTLRHSSASPTEALRTDDTQPTYGSDGLLLHRFAHRNLQPQAPVSPTQNSDLYVFYFAGRPVATLENVSEGSTAASTWQYLTVDHLGTPVLVTDPAGVQVWQGGFEPFGGSYSSAPTILRFPGQWVDGTWDGGRELYYNVHRWYEAGRGRYTQPDPLGREGGPHLFTYAGSNPANLIDPLGLKVELWCAPLGAGGQDRARRALGRAGLGHCFVRVRCDCASNEGPYDRALEILGRDETAGSRNLAEFPSNLQLFGPRPGAVIVPFSPSDWDSSNCETENCILRRYQELKKLGYYYPLSGYLYGPNSNTFAQNLLRACGVTAIYWPEGLTGVERSSP